MPTGKDLKRLVRARMRKTGESYTAARTKLIEKRPPRGAATTAKTSAKATKPAARAADLAALAGTSDAAVAAKTGRTWQEWVDVLDRAGAAALDHRSIARIVHAEHGVPGWWSQTVAVGYERIRGLRAPGQRRDGSWEVGKSKVYRVPLAWLDGAELRMSKATKHKTMRMRFSDGTPVEAHFLAKGPGKSQVAIQHRKLASRADADRMRAFWTGCLARLGKVLDSTERSRS